MRRVLVVAPGRGAYGSGELGSFERGEAIPSLVAAREKILPALDGRRRELGRVPIRELDGAAEFATIHLAPENTSALTFGLSAVEGAAILESERIQPVALCGNSLGWYTALFLSGALSLADAHELVETMAALQAGGADSGGQIVYPLCGDDWRQDPDRGRAVNEAIAQAGRHGRVFLSVLLGGYAVLAGDPPGIEALTELLPKATSGGRTYPIRLPGHGPFHTPLVAERAAAARHRLEHLEFRRPRVPLLDGRGRQHRPLTTHPNALADHTLGEQVVRTFDLASALRVGLREYAPDAVLLLGPGESIGGAIGMAIVREGYRGIRCRDDFDRAQASEEPILLSAGRKGVIEALLR